MTLDTQFLIHNTHHETPERFAELDPQLRRLNKQYYIYHAPLLAELPLHQPGIYSITGGRQVGKTTLIKQWMQELIKKRIAPRSINYITGELIDDHHSLLRHLQEILTVPTKARLRYIIIDEVSYIKEWDKAIKYAADAGMLDDVILILTGSDTIMINEARMRFPGRRGAAAIVDFHLHPLSFKEYIHLTQNLQITSAVKDKEIITTLFAAFDHYLLHGGYLTAINDYAKDKKINDATLQTYSDWIRGDMLKRGKQEHYLREILQAIIKHYGSQISWNTLAKDLSIDHPKTVADYITLLTTMDVAYIQSALLEDKLVAAPKKAKKVYLQDPFIFHAVKAWLNPGLNIFETQIIPTVSDPIWKSKIVEATAINHIARQFPTFYIKAEGEVDIAYVANNHFWPIEIKWTQQLHSKDLKQVLKYPRAKIWTGQQTFSELDHIPVEPLPWALVVM